jgi:hypothetical protein
MLNTIINLTITGFLNFFPSSGILGTRKHEVSKTESVSVLRCGGQDTYSVGSLIQVQ